MPARRQVLAVGAVATLAGCLGGEEPPGIYSTWSDLERSVAEEATPVARDAGGSGNRPGEVDVTATVYESGEGGAAELVLLSEHRITPGPHQWTHSVFAGVHDWEASLDGEAIRDHATNTAPTEDSQAPLRVQESSTSTRGQWTVHLTPPTESPVTYRLATWVSATDLVDGDTVVRVADETTFGQAGLLGDEETVSTNLELVYGET